LEHVFPWRELRSSQLRCSTDRNGDRDSAGEHCNQPTVSNWRPERYLRIQSAGVPKRLQCDISESYEGNFGPMALTAGMAPSNRGLLLAHQWSDSVHADGQQKGEASVP